MSDDRIATFLEGLSTKLGVTAEHLWAVLIAQARIDFYVTIVQYALVAVLVYFTVRLTRFVLKPSTDDGWWFLAGPAIFASVVFVVAAFFSLPYFVASIANPEYWALHEILSTFKRK